MAKNITNDVSFTFMAASPIGSLLTWTDVCSLVGMSLVLLGCRESCISNLKEPPLPSAHLSCFPLS